MIEGRAVVTNGPLLDVTVDGLPPGSTVELGEDGGRVTLRARVHAYVPLQTFRVVRNGEVVDEVSPELMDGRWEFEGTYDVEESGWFHVRVSGVAEDRFPLDTSYPQAFSNPIWVTVGDRPVRSAEAAEYGIAWMDELRSQMEAWPWWRSDEEKARVFEQVERARRIFEERRP